MRILFLLNLFFTTPLLGGDPLPIRPALLPSHASGNALEVGLHALFNRQRAENRSATRAGWRAEKLTLPCAEELKKRVAVGIALPPIRFHGENHSSQRAKATRLTLAGLKEHVWSEGEVCTDEPGNIEDPRISALTMGLIVYRNLNAEFHKLNINSLAYPSSYYNLSTLLRLDFPLGKPAAIGEKLSGDFLTADDTKGINKPTPKNYHDLIAAKLRQPIEQLRFLKIVRGYLNEIAADLEKSGKSTKTPKNLALEVAYLLTELDDETLFMVLEWRNELMITEFLKRYCEKAVASSTTHHFIMGSAHLPDTVLPIKNLFESTFPAAATKDLTKVFDQTVTAKWVNSLEGGKNVDKAYRWDMPLQLVKDSLGKPYVMKQEDGIRFVLLLESSPDTVRDDSLELFPAGYTRLWGYAADRLSDRKFEQALQKFRDEVAVAYKNDPTIKPKLKAAGIVK